MLQNDWWMFCKIQSKTTINYLGLFESSVVPINGSANIHFVGGEVLNIEAIPVPGIMDSSGGKKKEANLLLVGPYPILLSQAFSCKSMPDGLVNSSFSSFNRIERLSSSSGGNCRISSSVSRSNTLITVTPTSLST